MAIVTRFIGVEQQVAGCPLASTPPSAERGACVGCRFNMVDPEEAQIGCVVRTPAATYDDALAQLTNHAPDLSSELKALLKDHRQLDGGEAPARRWVAVAGRWYDTIDEGASELHMAMVIARFARASIELGQPAEMFV